MEKILMVGRLFSENKGIEQLIEFCVKRPNLRYLILCGKDTNGHYPADALISLVRYGLDENRKIINTKAPYPFIECSTVLVNQFREQIKLIDMRECLDLDKITEKVNELT
jgi:tetrahydromethanopterin S-methyltransferase subunit A